MSLVDLFDLFIKLFPYLFLILFFYMAFLGAITVLRPIFKEMGIEFLSHKKLSRLTLVRFLTVEDNFNLYIVDGCADLLYLSSTGNTKKLHNNRKPNHKPEKELPDDIVISLMELDFIFPSTFFTPGAGADRSILKFLVKNERKDLTKLSRLDEVEVSIWDNQGNLLNSNHNNNYKPTLIKSEKLQDGEYDTITINIDGTPSYIEIRGSKLIHSRVIKINLFSNEINSYKKKHKIDKSFKSESLLYSKGVLSVIAFFIIFTVIYLLPTSMTDKIKQFESMIFYTLPLLFLCISFIARSSNESEKTHSYISVIVYLSLCALLLYITYISLYSS